MKLLIIEDEKLAAERLQFLLSQYDDSIEVTAVLDSVKETVHYLKTKPQPDLLLLDIHLSDGHSFDIFRQINFQRPVIFTTAFDDYALDAFKILSVDYILKPVTLEALASALNKFKQLVASFIPIHYKQLHTELYPDNYKKRFLGKVGQRLFFLQTNVISYFQADNKIVHLVDREGHRYVIDATMEKLMEQLDPKVFFRLNRTYIANIDAIRQIKPYHNNRLRAYLDGAPNDEEILVSRERVAEFREWANNG
jgi:DNA-binding LytR/AlgR family response regulator